MARRRPIARSTRRLRRARRDGTPVYIRRDGLGQAAPLPGYILAVSRAWTLLAVLDRALATDGYVAIRTRDVTGVRPIADTSTDPSTGVRHHLPLPFDVVLASASTVVAGASDVYPLLTVYTEDRDRLARTRHLGRVVRCGQRKLRLHELTVDGRWRRRPREYRMKAVTAVGFGSSFERALTAYAGWERRLTDGVTIGR